jgi:hypothetical protein
MTTAERIYKIIDALTPEQQEYLLEVAQQIARPQIMSRDQLLELPLQERARWLDLSLANLAVDDYELFEASDPIHDYDDTPSN